MSDWWSAPLGALEAELEAGPEGLTARSARARLKRTGLNQFRDRTRRPLWLEFLRRFRNPLVLILVAAGALSALTGETVSVGALSLMVLFSVVLDFTQEVRAGRAAERLRGTVRLRCRVLRDGAERELAATHIVPGDVVLLRAGALVPADGRLIEAQHLFVDQALLTGEAFPVEKRAALGEAQEDAERLAAPSAVFMGSSVVSGAAKLLVCRTGKATAIGELAQTLARAAPPTAFELGTRRFGMLIMRITALMVLFVLLVDALGHKPLLESFLFAIALAVGLTPELLPMVVSVTMARGALRMAEQRVIVKRLAAMQNLGAMDVLCTDKTGTLTEAKIRLERHVDLAGTEREDVLLLAYLNSRLETGLRNPLDEAILEHEEVDISAWRKIAEAPFDFERRRVSVLVDDGRTRMLVVKGAPEELLGLSTDCLPDGLRAGPQPLDAARRATAQAQCAALGRDGFRVLGIAIKTVPATQTHAEVSDEAGLVFAGFAAFLDPPKASAAKALSALAESGVDVKILTGDNELVTRHVCARLEIPVIGVLTGAEIARLDDQALRAQVEGTNLFCRVDPVQKNRVLLALKKNGHVVGYLGDGINDAPALHSADVGISVDSAVDVAKEAADLILMKHDLGVLRAGVREGRRTFANIRKYIMMGTSSNFGNMFSMAGAAVFLPFLPMLPAQILLNNVLYDVSELPIPLDEVDEAELAAPRVWDLESIARFMWIIGPVSSIFDFLTFYLLLRVLEADETLFHTGWFVESLATQVLVIFVIRTQGSVLRSRPSLALAATSLMVVAVALALPYTPAAAYLGFAPLPPVFFALLAGTVFVYLCAAQAAKRLFYRHWAEPPAKNQGRRSGAGLQRGSAPRQGARRTR